VLVVGLMMCWCIRFCCLDHRMLRSVCVCVCVVWKSHNQRSNKSVQHDVLFKRVVVLDVLHTTCQHRVGNNQVRCLEHAFGVSERYKKRNVRF
jgi:hypothetical protein